MGKWGREENKAIVKTNENSQWKQWKHRKPNNGQVKTSPRKKVNRIKARRGRKPKHKVEKEPKHKEEKSQSKVS